MEILAFSLGSLGELGGAWESPSDCLLTVFIGFGVRRRVGGEVKALRVSVRLTDTAAGQKVSRGWTPMRGRKFIETPKEI